MGKIIWEIIFYFIFIYLLFMVAYGNRDAKSYWVNWNYDNMFLKALYDDNNSMGTNAMPKVEVQ